MDSFSLQRFVDAQAPVWDDVRAELARARKRTHWMWFVFPQLAALGRSATARFYGISGADEAKAYLQHPLLGPRLLECCALLLKTTGVSASEVFGRVATGQQAMRPKGDCAMKAPADPEGRKRLLALCMAWYRRASSRPSEAGEKGRHFRLRIAPQSA
jgi:uncharacterized protein (DUF1810 family)